MENQMGGLLGNYGGMAGQGAAPMAPAAPGGNPGLQMAQQLAQNPTPQMAQQIVQQMRQAGMPEADQFAQFFEKAGNDADALKQIANAVIQSLSGQ